VLYRVSYEPAEDGGHDPQRATAPCRVQSGGRSPGGFVFPVRMTEDPTPSPSPDPSRFERAAVP
jgi:hypothetical protein